jgi:hypothetical protein
VQFSAKTLAKTIMANPDLKQELLSLALDLGSPQLMLKNKRKRLAVFKIDQRRFYRDVYRFGIHKGPP